jgi:hypothetical protein
MNFDTIERYKRFQLKRLRIDCSWLWSCLLSLTSLEILTRILSHGVNGHGVNGRGVNRRGVNGRRTRMTGVITVLVKMTLRYKDGNRL